MTTRGKLYTYFEKWLLNHELMDYTMIKELMGRESELEKYWNKFKIYARLWIQIQKGFPKPETDLNKIKFMRQVAMAA